MTSKRREKMEYLVVRHNDLVQKSQHALTEQQQNILNYMVAEVKMDDAPDTIYNFSIREFAETYDLNMDGGYYVKAIKDDIDYIDKQRMWLIDDIEHPNRAKWTRLQWLNILRIDNGAGIVEYNFHTDIRPYLFQLQNYFDGEKQKYLATLSGLYSKKLYAFLKSQAYKHKAVFAAIEYLRILLACEDNYTKYADFKRYVLDDCMEQINKYTDIAVKYCVSKKGARGMVLELAFRVDILGESEMDDAEMVKRETEMLKKLGLE